MIQSLAEWDHHLRNRVTAIKLALQVLDQKTELTSQQRELTTQALKATEKLAVELFGQVSQSAGLELDRPCEPRRGERAPASQSYEARSLEGRPASSRSARRT